MGNTHDYRSVDSMLRDTIKELQRQLRLEEAPPEFCAGYQAGVEKRRKAKENRE